MFCVDCFGTGGIDGVGYCNCSLGRFENEKAMGLVKQISDATKRRTEIFKYEKPSFQESDWVEVDGSYITGKPKIKGYIISMDVNHQVAIVQTTWNSLGKSNHRIWVNFKHLTKMQQETEPDLLIDLALATRDEQWFTQLTRGME